MIDVHLFESIVLEQCGYLYISVVSKSYFGSSLYVYTYYTLYPSFKKLFFSIYYLYNNNTTILSLNQ